MGDIVSVNLPSGESKEGLVIEVIGRGRVRVDCGDQVHLVSVLDCSILKGATELEVGDRVEMQPQGSFLYFTGHILNINKVIFVSVVMKLNETWHVHLQDGTYDVVMEAEPGEAGEAVDADIETNVPRDNIRKLSSNRLKAQFKRGGWAVVAIHAFATSTNNSMKGMSMSMSSRGLSEK